MKNIFGYDAKRIVRNASGLGNYGRTLVNALAALAPETELLLYAPDAGREDLRAQVENADNIAFRYSSCHTSVGKDLWRRSGMIRDLKRDGVELFHGLTGELPNGLRKAGIPGVVTIHDLIFLRHPEYYHRIDAWLYRRKFFATLREADRIIAISECTKRDILYYSDYPADRIDVIYQSCDRQFARRVSTETMQAVNGKYRLPQDFVLNVGTIEKRKNILLAVKSMPRWPKNLHLVIVGRATPYAKEVMAAAQSLGVEDRVHLLHGVPTGDLIAIYRLAQCFVYPSRYEGFGIPVIEAIQSGLPVVAATGSCLEEAGGQASLYVSPDDADAMAHAIATAINERERRVSESQTFIRHFENGNVAKQVMEVYQRTLCTSGPGTMTFHPCHNSSCPK